MSTALRLVLALLVAGSAACGKKQAASLEAAIDEHHDAAMKVARDTAAMCPSLKAFAAFPPDRSAPAAPLPAHPAKGTSLERDPRVVDVFVSCAWHVPAAGDEGEAWPSTSLPSLKSGLRGVTKRETLPYELKRNTCDADYATDCEQVVMPSSIRDAPGTADLRVLRKAADGARAGVTVVFALP